MRGYVTILCAWGAVLALCACGNSDDENGASAGSAGVAGAGGSMTGGSAGTAGSGGLDAASGDAQDDAAPDAAPDAPADALHVLEGYLLGDFDNQAQFDSGFGQLVERHVCPIPGREDPSVLWLYVEHVEVIANGDRDSYFTRVNEITTVDGAIVSRAYKFDTGHPLYSNAFAYNGPIDGCTQVAVLQAITDADIVYRDGCDVTFEQDGEVFHATTQEGTCTFPGGYITTEAEVTADGMDVTDHAYQGGGDPIGETFEFRRVEGWVPPS
jgi:hypothetical protein